MSWLKVLGLSGRETAPVEPAPEPFVERRAEERRAVFHDAVVLLEGSYQLRVAITNLSSRGARIDFAGRSELPFRVRINAPTLKLQCWARVVWQDEGRAGLEFQPE